MYAVYTVLTSLQQDDGLITCVLFYGQMSLFASYQRLQSSVSADTSSSAVSSWFARVTQFESITSLYSRTCYGKDMGAYAVTAAQLSGPAIVLVLSVAITLALKRAQSFFQQRNFNVKVSVSATLSTTTEAGAVGTFSCADGRKTVPASFVNDDYCDCKDGSGVSKFSILTHTYSNSDRRARNRRL